MSERDRSSLDAAEKKYDESFGFDPKPGERKSADESRSGLANAEKSGGQDEKKAIKDTAAGKTAMAAASAGGPVGKIAAQILGRMKTKEGGVGAAVAVVILMISAVGFFTTFLAPVAFIENVLDDLNDQLAALDIRQTGMMRAKVTYDEKNKAFKGCSKLSIRCKAKSLSATQMKNFDESGIKVKGKTIKFAGVERTFPETYTFNNKEMKPAEFVNEMKTNKPLRLSFKCAVNMKFRAFTDNKFINWTQKKFGFSKKKATLSGTEEERIKQLASVDGDRITPETKFIEVTDEDGNKYYVVEDGDPTVRYTAEQKIALEEKFANLAKISGGLGSLGTQALKAVSIVGWVDMACSVKNMIGIAATTTRVLNQKSLAQYAAPIWATSHSQKASDISAEDSTALNTYFLGTDARKEVPDFEATLKAAGVTDESELENSPNMEQVVMKPNPYYGKNALDSPLYKMSAYGGLPAMTEASTRYSLGFGASGLLAAVGATAQVADTILNLGTDGVPCDIIQNWAVRGISAIIGAIAAFFSGGTTAAVNIAIMTAIGVAFFAISAALLAALTKDIIPENISELPEERAAATWTGLAVINGETARASGMMPGSAEEIAEYRNLQLASIKDYVAIETEDTSPFDLRSPYSKVGRSLIALQEFQPDSYTAGGVVAALTSMQASALKAPFNQSASAVDYLERFNKCDDVEYNKPNMNIDADVQCNVRYIMSPADLERNTEDVIDYMESNGYVELDAEVGESVTGFPEGYTPPNPAETTNAIEGVVSSVVDGFVSQFYNSRTYGTTEKGQEYGKFLDYCVYRSMPFGNTYEENGAWGSAGREWLSGERCMSNDTEISNFRVYTMDVRLVDISEKVEETTDTPLGVGAGTPTGTVNGSTANLAQQILDLEAAGKIRITPYASANIPFDTKERTLPLQQLQDIAAGKLPAKTTRCEISYPGPIIPDPKLLQFLVNLGQQYNYQINSLYGQCHHPSSSHYLGKAVDFGCPLNTALADKIGKPFDIRHNYENCANDAHWHYMIGTF